MFGCSAVFAFLAQDALSPGSAGAASEAVREGASLNSRWFVWLEEGLGLGWGGSGLRSG